MKKVVFILFFILPVWLFSQTGLYQPLGGGMYNGGVRSMAIDSINNELYITGLFNNIGGKTIKFLAKWDGYIWDSIPELPITIEKFEYLDGELYAYGYKTIWKKINNIWTLIATANGNNGFSCIAKYNNDLLIMGGFDSINNIPLNCFALYDGTNLLPFSNYMTWPANGRQFWTAAVYNNELYVGGNHADNSGTIKCLMKWNGSQWVSVGGGITGGFASVSKLIVYNNKLFVGGPFNKAQGNPGNSIFSYDGINYDDLGGGLFTNLFDMAVHDNKLFIVGPCKTNTGREFKGFVIFNGTDFCFHDSVICNASPGSGFLRLAFYNDTLIVGGSKLAFNGDTIQYIGKYIGDFIPDSCMTVTGVNELAINNQELNIYPNPVQSQITIEFELTETKNISIEIKNILGQTVKTIDNRTFRNGKNKIEIDVSEFSKGLYIVQLKNESEVIRKKFVKE